jgi:hypothetical protein
MLNPEPRKLRYLGIDLHPRWLRRCVVVLTYLVYFIVMIVIAQKTKSVVVLQSYHLGFWLMALVSILMGAFGVFRDGGPVLRFTQPVWRLSGTEGSWMMLRGLDDRAKYSYGKNFDGLAEEQQKELLRTYRVGNYLFPADGKARGADDERESAERERASGRTIVRLTQFCFAMAGIYAFSTARPSPEGLAAMFLTIGFYAMTGAKANILWNEIDPRRTKQTQTEVNAGSIH